MAPNSNMFKCSNDFFFKDSTRSLCYYSSRCIVLFLFLAWLPSWRKEIRLLKVSLPQSSWCSLFSGRIPYRLEHLLVQTSELDILNFVFTVLKYLNGSSNKLLHLMPKYSYSNRCSTTELKTAWQGLSKEGRPNRNSSWG